MRVLLLGFAIALGAGCVHTAFTPTTTMRLAGRPTPCYLDLILQGIPPYPYVVIGSVTTDSTAPGLWALGENNEVALERLREEACRQGAHGIMKANAQSEGTWNGDGYSKSTTGNAVAFVYVDAAGQPLPPPTGPRTIIHPGALAMPPPAAAPGAQPPPAPPPDPQ